MSMSSHKCTSLPLHYMYDSPCLYAVCSQMARSTAPCAQNIVSHIFLFRTLPMTMFYWSTVPTSITKRRLEQVLELQFFRNIQEQIHWNTDYNIWDRHTASELFFYLRISSSRRVPFSAANSRSCILFKSFWPSGASIPCRSISRICKKEEAIWTTIQSFPKTPSFQ